MLEPVLQERCQEYHRAGEAAPMSLMNYQEARPWAAAIQEAAPSKKMPPWFADAAHGAFQNDRRLKQSEIDTLKAWARSGAKEGKPSDAPKPREFAAGWAIGKPGVVGFTEDRWVSRVEVRPGNKAVVHHTAMDARAPGSTYMKDAKPGAIDQSRVQLHLQHQPPHSPGDAARKVLANVTVHQDVELLRSWAATLRQRPRSRSTPNNPDPKKDVYWGEQTGEEMLAGKSRLQRRASNKS